MSRNFQNFNKGMQWNEVSAAGMRTLVDAAKRIDNIHAVPPLYVQRRASSITIGMHPQRIQRRGGAGGDAVPAIVTTNHDNHLTCTLEEGDDAIQVAKPWDFRRSTWDDQTFTRGGQSVSYGYLSVDSRTSTVVGTPDEQEFIIHSYEVGDELEVLPISHATGVAEVDGAGRMYIDLNVGGRNWGFVDPQT